MQPTGRSDVQHERRDFVSTENSIQERAMKDIGQRYRDGKDRAGISNMMGMPKSRDVTIPSSRRYRGLPVRSLPRLLSHRFRSAKHFLNCFI